MGSLGISLGMTERAKPSSRPLFSGPASSLSGRLDCTTSRPRTSSCGNDITATSWGLSRIKPKILWYSPKSMAVNDLRTCSLIHLAKTGRQREIFGSGYDMDLSLFNEYLTDVLAVDSRVRFTSHYKRENFCRLESAEDHQNQAGIGRAEQQTSRARAAISCAGRWHYRCASACFPI